MSKYAIGGYFELELQSNPSYVFKNLIHLNSGRNALEYILKVRNYKLIYIPYFSCEVLLEPIKKLNIDYKFYDIDDNLNPIFDYDILDSKTCIFLINYFGINSKEIESICLYNKNIIVDNAQALFADPIKGIDTIYSPRKFIGIPDGGLVSTNKKIKDKLATDISINRFSHLIKRIDLSPEEGYQDFINSNNSIKDQPLLMMSKLSHSIMKSLDFDEIKALRIKNYKILHKSLKDRNDLKGIDLKTNDVPMVYPYRLKRANELRKVLIENRIFVPIYWPNVLKWCSTKFNSYQLTNEILALPIDQRYDKKQMEVIINLINDYV